MRFKNNAPLSKGGSEVPIKRRYAMSMPSNPEVPPTSGTVTQDMIDFADAWQALAEPTHAGMAQDEAMQREMILATGILANRADCTHVAVQDGDWTSATTWLRRSDDTFAVPGAGAKIGIPSGITVTMDNNTTTAYDTMRIDGDLIFAIDQDTKLYIDTIVVHHTGTWTQGTSLNPIPSAYTSEVVFPDNGDIDTTLVTGDYLLLGRGLICMGDYTVHGATKDHWGDTNQSLAVGATSVTLDSAPSGWAVGDEIQIMATDCYGWVSSTPRTFSPHQVDNATITNISGSTITFSPATTYAHSVVSYTGMTDLKYKVVNFTRNIKYSSPSGTLVHRRGHVMIMHGTCNVAHASYDDLGRTRKGLLDPSFDATNHAARIREEGGDVAFSADANVRGRYNFHIHRIGVDAGDPFAEVTNIACSNAPGWLIAHHQSRANFTNCVGRDFLGSGLVAEVGSETGKWLNCYMGGGKETSAYVSSQVDKGEYLEESYGTPVNGVLRNYANDFGRNNNCYWLKGRAVEIDGCVSSGAGRGIVWMARGGFGANSAPLADDTPEPRVFYGYKTNAGGADQDAPILLVKNCLVVGTDIPLLIIKNSPNQEHSLRTHIHSNTMWNNAWSVEFEYTGHYTVENNRIARTARSGNPIVRDRAFNLAQVVVDFYISNNVVRFFSKVAQHTVNNTQFPTFDHGNVIVDDQITDAPTLLTRTFQQTPADANVSSKTVASGSYSDVDPTWTPSSEPVWPTGELWGKWFVFLGNLTTEFETRNRVHETADTDIILNNTRGSKSAFNEDQLTRMLLRYGYYTYTHPTHGASNYLLVPDLISRKLPTTPGGDIPVRYLTVPVRLTGVSLTNYTNQGALPQRYVDAIALGDPGIADPGSPAAGAAAYVVYEDIFGAGNLYEGL